MRSSEQIQKELSSFPDPVCWTEKGGQIKREILITELLFDIRELLAEKRKPIFKLHNLVLPKWKFRLYRLMFWKFYYVKTHFGGVLIKK